MNNPRLTYLVSTFNKINYLREVLQRLLLNCSHGDEIIIVDGGSTDGTVGYLNELYNKGLITLFVSERDFGEAHGFNKGLLMARGQLIKIISDDDAFYWPGIKSCVDFMQANENIDIMGSDGGFFDWRQSQKIAAITYENDFSRYKESGRPFAFCGLGLLIRRTSLPMLGLFDTNFMRIDAEYSLRVTSGRVQLAWCANPLWLRIVNPASNSVKQARRGQIEGELLDQRYYRSIILFRQIARQIKDIFRPLKNKIYKNKFFAFSEDKWPEAFIMCDFWLEKNNKNSQIKFLTRDINFLK